ncbi:hypothetical protein HK405_003993 [Cladochytrium tenue]|nr:hypothetical protein HK405_003993 [Cladochytrium tenue]
MSTADCSVVDAVFPALAALNVSCCAGVVGQGGVACDSIDGASRVVAIDFSKNLLSGEVPASIGNLNLTKLFTNSVSVCNELASAGAIAGIAVTAIIATFVFGDNPTNQSITMEITESSAVSDSYGATASTLPIPPTPTDSTNELQTVVGVPGPQSMMAAFVSHKVTQLNKDEPLAASSFVSTIANNNTTASEASSVELPAKPGALFAPGGRGGDPPQTPRRVSSLGTDALRGGASATELLRLADFPGWVADRLSSRSVADMLLMTPEELAAIGLSDPVLLARFRALVRAAQEARWTGGQGATAAAMDAPPAYASPN